VFLEACGKNGLLYQQILDENAGALPGKTVAHLKNKRKNMKLSGKWPEDLL